MPVAPGPARRGAHHYIPVIAGLLVSALVCFPWIGRGWVWMLDWTPGSHAPLLPASAFGLQGGLVGSLPLGLLLGTLGTLIGSSVTVLPAVLFFPLAMAGAAELAGGRLSVRIAAGLLYAVNPFVYDRLFVGQFGILLGYALLPWALRSLLRLPSAPAFSWLATSLWWTLLIGMAPHFVWIFGVCLAMTAIAWRLRPRVLVRLAVVAAATALTTTYALLAGAAGGVGQHIGARNLAAYATRADPRLGLVANVAALYGFWRQGPLLAKQVIGGWPAIWLAVLLLASVGMARAVRDARRAKAIVVSASGVAGLLLAMGAQGPTGPLFRFAYYHLPYFAIMREPQKFAMLWALAISVGFGWGVSELLERARSRKARAIWAAVVLALPIAYEPLAFGGLAGQVRPTHLPRSWSRVNQIMGSGPGRVLVLPWHLYLAFPYTQMRAVSNPAPQLLRRPVISGDNVQLPNLQTTSTSPRSAYLAKLFAQAPFITDFGQRIAPLGITYVLVEKTVDWRNYGWIHLQTDLHSVYDSSSLHLYRNTAPAPQAQVDLGNKLVGVGKRISPISYRMPATPPGGLAQISDAYQAGWIWDGREGHVLATGNIGWRGPLPAGKATFAPATLAISGLVISAATVAGLFAVVIGSRAFRARRS